MTQLARGSVDWPKRSNRQPPDSTPYILGRYSERLLERLPAISEVSPPQYLRGDAAVVGRDPGIRVSGSSVRAGPRPGDRLGDQDVTHQGQRIRLHDLTSRPGVHVLLRRGAADLDPQLLGSHVVVHRISNWPGDGLVAVRPDGHVGFACDRDDHGQLAAWLDLIGPPVAPPDQLATRSGVHRHPIRSGRLAAIGGPRSITTTAPGHQFAEKFVGDLHDDTV